MMTGRGGGVETEGARTLNKNNPSSPSYNQSSSYLRSVASLTIWPLRNGLVSASLSML